MDRYVYTADPEFRWEDTGNRMRSKEGGGWWTGYVLKVYTHQWLNRTVTNRYKWWHWLILMAPDKMHNAHKGLVLFFVGAGLNPVNQVHIPGADEIFIRLAAPVCMCHPLCRMVVDLGILGVMLQQVPMMPISFKVGPPGIGPRAELIEEEITAHTLAMFLDHPDEWEWLTPLPMAKSIIRALDATQLAVRELLPHVPVEGFVAIGVSKRAGMSYFAAALDKVRCSVASNACMPLPFFIPSPLPNPLPHLPNQPPISPPRTPSSPSAGGVLAGIHMARRYGLRTHGYRAEQIPLPSHPLDPLHFPIAPVSDDWWCPICSTCAPLPSGYMCLLPPPPSPVQRVVAFITYGYDLLNLVPNLQHMHDSLGGWPILLKFNSEYNISQRLHSNQYRKAAEVIDPYTLIDRMDMPKLLISASNDEFFLIDDSSVLPCPFMLLHVPSCHAPSCAFMPCTFVYYFVKDMPQPTQLKIGFFSRIENPFFRPPPLSPLAQLLFHEGHATAHAAQDSAQPLPHVPSLYNMVIQNSFWVRPTRPCFSTLSSPPPLLRLFFALAEYAQYSCRALSLFGEPLLFRDVCPFSPLSSKLIPPAPLSPPPPSPPPLSLALPPLSLSPPLTHQAYDASISFFSTILEVDSSCASLPASSRPSLTWTRPNTSSSSSSSSSPSSLRAASVEGTGLFSQGGGGEGGSENPERKMLPWSCTPKLPAVLWPNLRWRFDWSTFSIYATSERKPLAVRAWSARTILGSKRRDFRMCGPFPDAICHVSGQFRHAVCASTLLVPLRFPHPHPSPPFLFPTPSFLPTWPPSPSVAPFQMPSFTYPGKFGMLCAQPIPYVTVNMSKPRAEDDGLWHFHATITDVPKEGYRAMFIEADFKQGTYKKPFTITTEAMVAPNTLPFSPCTKPECYFHFV
ncbi:unnamed protein product [Closterium sp. NIES-65]|nr:unnamed protein product [Closterium sp. NIES-65]